MVMSFQGQQAKQQPETKQIVVRDFMTSNIITFRPEQTMDEVIHILLEKRISGGPVVDAENRLVGVISEGDCMKQVVKGKYLNTPSLGVSVCECMVTDVKTVSPNLNILEAAQMFLQLRIRRFPVVEAGELLGQISQKDIMKAVHNI